MSSSWNFLLNRKEKGKGENISLISHLLVTKECIQPLGLVVMQFYPYGKKPELFKFQTFRCYAQ